MNLLETFLICLSCPWEHLLNWPYLLMRIPTQIIGYKTHSIWALDAQEVLLRLYISPQDFVSQLVLGSTFHILATQVSFFSWFLNSKSILTIYFLCFSCHHCHHLQWCFLHYCDQVFHHPASHRLLLCNWHRWWRVSSTVLWVEWALVFAWNDF